VCRPEVRQDQPDGTFADATTGSGLDVAGSGMGVAVGDVDNDGLPDLALTEYVGTRLFLNLGGGKFADVSAEAGIRNPLWGASAAFFDADGDGRLDLFVVNYVDYDPSKQCRAAGGGRDFCSPRAFDGTPSRLFRNLGPRGPSRVVFEDVSVRAGLAARPGPGLGVLCADFTNDGRQDVFVANDGEPNRLWVNRGDGTFADEAVSRGLAYTHMGQAFAGMGVAVGDVDGDGLLDLYVTHLTTESNTLWKQGPPGVFRDRTATAGLASTRWRGTGFGTHLADFDLDGSLDLAVVNGRVLKGTDRAESVPAFWAPYAERNRLLANDGTGTFRDVSADNPAFCGTPNVGRGLACCDLDGDGRPDLVVNATAGRARLFRNVAPVGGHWLAVRAVDPAWKRDAYGAEVTVSAGGRPWVRLISSAGSIYSAGPPVAQFGLGAAGEFESAEVRWPDGSRELFPGGPADRSLTLNRGQGRPTGAAR
jgi:hypothetical protein